MKILFFTEISPFPMNGGEKIRSYGLIKILSELGYEVIAVIRNDSNVDLKKYEIRNVDFVIQTHNISLIRRLFRISYFVVEKEIIKIFDDILEKECVDVAFLDFGFIGNYISYFKKKNIPVLLGTHNSQTELTLQMPVRNLIDGLRKYQNYMTQLMHEYLYFKKSDIIIAVSEYDALYHKRYKDIDKIHIVPNYVDDDLYESVYEKENYYVMPANFNVYMNRFGLEWFIEKVWDVNIDKKERLLLIGRGSKEVLMNISASKKYKNIIAVGEVSKVDEYIGKSKAVIIPLLHGSGTRLKCIEAMALRTAIISTPKGVEGIKSKAINIAKNEEEFKHYLLNYRRNKEVENKLYVDYKENYSLSSNKKKLYNIISDMIKERCIN